MSKQMANDEREHESQDDVADLRAQLKLAQERLSTYQRFDRDIAENVRRSSELMLEAMQVRDRVEGEATEQARAQRERLVHRLQSIEDELGAIQGQVAAMLERVADLRQEFEREPGASSGQEPISTDGGDEAVEAPAPSVLEEADAADETAGAPSAEPAEPRSVDLIAHGMTRTASALALQSHLRALDQVEAVDAREFSSGVLRLQLEVVGDLTDADLLGWEGAEEVTVHRHPDDAIELRIGE